jgi:hypothetical protein
MKRIVECTNIHHLHWAFGLGLPVAASGHAGQVDEILVSVHWMMLVL